MKKIFKYISRGTKKIHLAIQKKVYLHQTQWGLNSHMQAQHLFEEHTHAAK